MLLSIFYIWFKYWRVSGKKYTLWKILKTRIKKHGETKEWSVSKYRWVPIVGLYVCLNEMYKSWTMWLGVKAYKYSLRSFKRYFLINYLSSLVLLEGYYLFIIGCMDRFFYWAGGKDINFFFYDIVVIRWLLHILIMVAAFAHMMGRIEKTA